MLEDKAFIRCQKCGTVNRIPKQKLHSTPRCGKCKSEIIIQMAPIEVTHSDFNTEVLKWPGFVLVDIWSPNCGYCNKLHPVLNELAQEYTGIIKFVKINTSQAPQLSSQFNIQGVPALFLYKNGRIINSISGFMPKHQLLDWLKSSM